MNTPGALPKSGLTWSQLEATGEIFSRGKSYDYSTSQAASYTLYLLQARPDLLSVTGMFFYPKKQEIALYLTDSQAVTYVEHVALPLATKLLVTWIRRLYKPKHEFAITRVGFYPDIPTFTIKAGHPKPFSQCSIMSVGAVHRRATIFQNQTVVIKSQYFEVGRRFEERQILGNIHKDNKDFPGVVRLKSTKSNPPAAGGSKSVGDGGSKSVGNGHHIVVPSGQKNKRRQSLLVLRDKVPKTLMDAETPLDALIAIYDLLEGNILSSFLE
jgi:hypothetical protein